MKLPMTRPRPPRMEAPPMMTEAMTMSSALRPDCGEMPLSCAIAISPAIVAQSDDSRYARTRTQRVVDAGVDRGLLVAAGGEGLVSPAGLGEHDRADARRRRARSESGC